MSFELQKAIEILQRTPAVLDQLLSGLSLEWLKSNEGADTWSPYDIVGHLIFGEKTDWMVRIKIILNEGENKRFETFDRFGQFEGDQNKPITELLKEFELLRANNLSELKDLNIGPKELKKLGIHPEFGEVSLEQLIASWAVHDLGHIAQISRVMAKQYQNTVGPWKQYLGIVRR